LSDAVCNFNHIESDQINADHNNNIKFIRNVSWNYILNSCTRSIVTPSGSMTKTGLLYYPCYNSKHDTPLYNLIVKYAGSGIHSLSFNSRHAQCCFKRCAPDKYSKLPFTPPSLPYKLRRRINKQTGSDGQKLLWNSNTPRTI